MRRTNCFRIFGCSVAALALFNGLTSCGLPQSDDPRSQFGAKAAKHSISSIVAEAELSKHVPLPPKQTAHLILEIDGGGIMGITPAIVLAEIEKQLALRDGCANTLLRDHFSVCVGTSTGSILAGLIVAGVSAPDICNYYVTDGVELFKHEGRNPFPLYPIFKYKFKRDELQKRLFDVLESKSSLHSASQTLDDLYDGPLLVIPAYDLVSRRTQFFRTRDYKDNRLSHNGKIQLADAISASAFSAALYFGKLPAPTYEWQEFRADDSNYRSGPWYRGSVFNDGGQGTQNSALGQTALEAIIRDMGNKWSKSDQVIIISLGCGNDYRPRDFSKLKNASGLTQICDFFAKNQARSESGLLQLLGLRRLAAGNPNFHFFRFDWEPDETKDPVDTNPFGVNDKQRDLYIQKARDIVGRQDFIDLMSDLKVLNNIAQPGPAPR